MLYTNSGSLDPAPTKSNSVNQEPIIQPIPGAPPGVQFFRLMLATHRSNCPVTAALISRLNAACQGAGSRFVLVTLPVPNNQMLYFREICYLGQQAKAQRIDLVDTNAVFPSLPPMVKSPLYLSK